MNSKNNEHANFTPSQESYLKMMPFNFFSQKVLPLVYDDSLSYYEVLCKLVKYINDMIENIGREEINISNLHEAFILLQKYVNDYFDNIDIEQEITDNINRLLNDGTITKLLALIINKNSYPTFVDSVDEMLDINKVYVLNTNGHIYTWNGSNFVDTQISYGIDNNVMKGLMRIDSSSVAQVEYDLDNVRPNSIVTIASNLGDDELAHQPEANRGGCMITMAFSFNTTSFTTQLFFATNGVIYFRMYTSNGWLEWFEFNNTKKLKEMFMTGGGIINNDLPLFDDCDDIRANTIYAVGSPNPLANLPYDNAAGTLMTIGAYPVLTSTTIQLLYDTRNELHMRMYRAGVWGDWKVIGSTNFVKGYYALTLDTIARFDNKLANVPCNSSFTVATNIYPVVDDMPTKLGGTLLTFGFSQTKTALSFQMYLDSEGNIFTRTFIGGAFGAWRTISPTNYNSIACFGDSIAYGYRNSRKGFIGEIPGKIQNYSVSGATLCDSTNTIYNQVPTSDAYDTTIVISDGGVNDYFKNQPLGTIPATPTDNVDTTTLLGGLCKLFYKWITVYPNARRLFVLTHKTLNWSFTKNTAGYTQTEMFDAIKQVCKLYNVEVIDIYNESPINTYFASYKGTLVDNDGIHPLDKGYKVGYMPYIRAAIDKL